MVTQNEKVTALIWAAEMGRADCVRLLLDGGAQKEAADKLRRTALILAASNGHADCLRLLVGNGADQEAKDNLGRTALTLLRIKPTVCGC
jgi:ankyrin repeat protein